MKKNLFLIIAMFLSLSVRATQTIERNLTINVGQTIEETLSGGSGMSIWNNYKDIVDCHYVKSNVVSFTGIKRGHASVMVQVPGYEYLYSISVIDVISIFIPSNLNLNVGDEYTFSPIVADAGANTTFTWNSSNTSSATIDTNGVLKAVGVGYSIITCTASNGVTAHCEVSVSINSIYVSEISLNTSEHRMYVGDKVMLEPIIVPSNATNKKVSWRSSNETVAVVTSDGLVIGVGEGLCAIFATTTDGSNLSASCLIYVSGTSNIDNLELSSSKNEIYYTLSGNIIEGMPRQKGVYIRNGKKIIIK